MLSAAAEAVRRVVALTYGHIQVGLVYTLHTFGRDLVFNETLVGNPSSPQSRTGSPGPRFGPAPQALSPAPNV